MTELEELEYLYEELEKANATIELMASLIRDVYRTSDSSDGWMCWDIEELFNELDLEL